MSEAGQNKSEAPSERRREESRRKGQVAYSHELTGGLAFFLGVVVLRSTGVDTWAALGSMLRAELLSIAIHEWTPELAWKVMKSAAMATFGFVAPITLTMWGLALVTGFIQTRGLLTFEPLAADPSRLSPAQGWQRIWSTRGLVKVAQILIRSIIIFAVAITSSTSEIRELLVVPYTSLTEVTLRAGSLSMRLIFVAAILLLVTGIVDYFFEWWKHENELKMTLKELKDERKQEEGDPHIKARIRRVQREINKKQMLRDAAKADVIVRNPTHFAVALKYTRGEMAAPRVVAKGADFLAERIIAIAHENRIPVLERKPLARALYRHVQVGQEIPLAFYQVVAEVLIYVDRLRRAA